MLSESKEIMWKLIVTTLIGYVIIYYLSSKGPIIYLLLTSVILTGLSSFFITLNYLRDKREQSSLHEKMVIHSNIKKMIDGVIKVERLCDKYKVYTDSEVYLVEYGESESLVVHVGGYERVSVNDL